MSSSAAAVKNAIIQARWELALGFLVLGVRLWIFSYAGSPLPYYDQWLAEFNNTFLQLAGGSGIWSMLFTPHNEHVLLTTKLVSWLGFSLNGYWDVRFLVVAAALVRAVEGALLFRLLSSGADKAARAIIWLGIVAIFVAPVSGFNLLCGLQVSFYFAELALIGSMFCLLHWSSAWRSGIWLCLLNLLGLCSMASALAIPVATLGTHLASGQKRRGFWVAWLLTFASAITYALVMSGVAVPRTANTPIGERAAVFAELISWPLMGRGAGIALVFVALAGIVWLARNARLSQRPIPTVVGLGVFGAVNLLLIALNRPADDFHPRHWEVAALVPLSLIALGANLFSFIERRKVLIAGFGFAVLIAYCAGFVAVWRQSWRYIESARGHRIEAVAFYRGVFTSDLMPRERARMNALLAEKNYTFFDDPILRFTPHPVVYRNMLQSRSETLAMLSPEILPSRGMSRVSRFVGWLTNAGWCFAAIGVLLVIANFLFWRSRSEQKLGLPTAGI
jgi:hypothetical protein